jgi:hypothetical protein
MEKMSTLEEKTLLRRFQYPTPIGKRGKKLVRKKIRSGLDVFSTVLHRTTRIERVFRLSRGRRSNTITPLLDINHVKVSKIPLTLDTVNEMSNRHNLDTQLSPESRLYQLVLEGKLPLLTKEEACDRVTILGQCLMIDSVKKKAIFPKDKDDIDLMMNGVGRVIYYIGSVPIEVEDSLNYCRKKLHKFSEKLASLCKDSL